MVSTATSSRSGRWVPVVLAALLSACGGVEDDATWTWNLPEGFPPPEVPADNPMTPAKVELGRHLFYDARLSEDESRSCASCHDQSRAFTDGEPRAIGPDGGMLPRNVLSLVNVAYAPSFNWANPHVVDLSEQAYRMLFGDEMGGPDAAVGSIAPEMLVERLEADAGYRALFADAYPDAAEPLTVDHAVMAIASFERSIVSADAPFDRHYAGTANLSDEAHQGMLLFFSERLECAHCHGGFNLSSPIDHNGNVYDQAAFFNNGLYNLDDRGSYPEDNTGLHDVSGKMEDMGKFRAPSLRNVALTAPYMHDGSIATLEEVIDHYARGGRLIEDGPHAGDGRDNPHKSEYVAGFELTDRERSALLTFLREALTDTSVVSNPAWSDPGQP